jgi:hypothetical protein
MPIDAVMHFNIKSHEGALFRSIKKKAQPCCRHVTAGLLVAHSGLTQPPRRMSAFRGKADAFSRSLTCPLTTQSGHPVVANGAVCSVALVGSSQCLSEAGRVYGVRTKPELMRRRWKARISLRGSQPEYRPAHTIISRLRSRCAAESGSPEASSITIPR